MVELFDRDDFRQEERAVYRPNSNGYLAQVSLRPRPIHTELGVFKQMQRPFVYRDFEGLS